MHARELKKANPNRYPNIHSNNYHKKPSEEIHEIPMVAHIVAFCAIFARIFRFFVRFCTHIRAFLVRFGLGLYRCCFMSYMAYARIFFYSTFFYTTYCATYLAKSWINSKAKSCVKILLAPLVLCLACASSPLSANTLEWEDLEDTQKALLKKLWAVGKPFDFHYALIAISYTESRLGLYPLNLQTYDCGVLHINIKSYLRFNKIKDSPLNRNIYCGNLIINEDLSINAALDTLQYFYNYWSKRKKNPLEYAIKSYNAGFKVNSRSAQKYYNKIYKNIKAVQKLEKQGLLRQQRANKVQ